MGEVISAFSGLAAALLLFVNAVLTSKGRNPLPFDETMVTEFITQASAVWAITWAWWKNNNVTKKRRRDNNADSKTISK